jgi:hypothetical protein
MSFGRLRVRPLSVVGRPPYRPLPYPPMLSNAFNIFRNHVANWRKELWVNCLFSSILPELSARLPINISGYATTLPDDRTAFLTN